MTWKHSIKGIIICHKCNKPEPRRAVTQKFCIECSSLETRRRRREWQNSRPREPKTKHQERQTNRSRFIKEHGQAVSQQLSKGRALFPDRGGSARVIEIRFPFTGHMLKNAIVNIGMMTGTPFIFIRKDIHKFREGIALLVQEQLNGFRWPVSKTWLDIVVQKPNNRCDAINVVDTVCDGLKVGLGVDDRWFAIGTLDWEIVLKDPMVFVQISTMALKGQKNCSTCGQIKDLEDGFRPHEATKDRFSAVCKDCTTALSRSKNKKMNGVIPAKVQSIPIPPSTVTRYGWEWCGIHENCEVSNEGKHQLVIREADAK